MSRTGGYGGSVRDGEKQHDTNHLIQSWISMGPGKHTLANRWTDPLFFVKKKLSFSGLASDSLVAIRQQIRRQHGPEERSS